MLIKQSRLISIGKKADKKKACREFKEARFKKAAKKYINNTKVVKKAAKFSPAVL
jgi:hypothetical protein